MEVCGEDDLHPERTSRRHLVYCFYPKHHGAGSSTDACWLPELTRPEEFAVFEMADYNDLSDEAGNLYGLRIVVIDEKRLFEELGTRHELIARFWAAEEQEHWHGHPLWPVREKRSLNRKRQRYSPPREVLDRMVESGVLTLNQSRRLKTGDHVRNLGEAPGG
jgi:hypothetical protein